MTDGPNIVVGELFARLTVVDTDDRLVGCLGEDGQARQRPGWPNGLGPTSTLRVTLTCSPGVQQPTRPRRRRRWQFPCG